MDIEKLIRGLIALGEEIAVKGKSSPPDIDWMRPHGRINVQAPEAWDKIAANLSVEELASLIMGLTTTEREFRWSGGSVAGVIWLFRYLEERYPLEVVEPIADWVIENRGNDYVPYGTIMLYGRSHVENIQIRIDREASARAYNEEQAKTRNDAKRRRESRRIQRENTKLARGSDFHKELIAKLKNMSTLEQLKMIAADEKYSITLYPKNVAGAGSKEILRGIDTELAGKLQAKLFGKVRGPWGKFKKRLGTHIAATDARDRL